MTLPQEQGKFGMRCDVERSDTPFRELDFPSNKPESSHDPQAQFVSRGVPWPESSANKPIQSMPYTVLHSQFYEQNHCLQQEQTKEILRPLSHQCKKEQDKSLPDLSSSGFKDSGQKNYPSSFHTLDTSENLEMNCPACLTPLILSIDSTNPLMRMLQIRACLRPCDDETFTPSTNTHKAEKYVISSGHACDPITEFRSEKSYKSEKPKGVDSTWIQSANHSECNTIGSGRCAPYTQCEWEINKLNSSMDTTSSPATTAAVTNIPDNAAIIANSTISTRGALDASNLELAHDRSAPVSVVNKVLTPPAVLDRRLRMELVNGAGHSLQMAGTAVTEIIAQAADCEGSSQASRDDMLETDSLTEHKETKEEFNSDEKDKEEKEDAVFKDEKCQNDAGLRNIQRNLEIKGKNEEAGEVESNTIIAKRQILRGQLKKREISCNIDQYLVDKEEYPRDP
ncbi:unnamed protein product [Protopolystoma xenopodis]|uniref:Uncharacterized protein n=1 Tax=Protopolystoma xenopodis TaxID=117903 RepID=A0A448WJN1_9PLAT|nr:unnamed protein product [Protopolystoma xenopodis]